MPSKLGVLFGVWPHGRVPRARLTPILAAAGLGSARSLPGYKILVDMEGLEPPTFDVQGRRSPAELHAHINFNRTFTDGTRSRI